MPAPVVSFDFETRSRADLKAVGPRRYADEAEVICMAYAIDDEDPVLWLPGDPFPSVFREAREFHAWNAGFERAIWARTCERLYGWDECPEPRLFVDTQARALLAGLPAALGLAALAVGLPADEQKDKRGRYMIQRLCKPKRDGSWNEDPALLREMFTYCLQDVKTERAIGRGLPPLPWREHRVWCLTESMNEGGLPMDVAAIRGAVGYCERALAALNAEASAAAGGDFATVTQLAKVHAWLASQGVELPDLRAETVDEALAGELPDPVRVVLAARRGAGLASVKKFAAAAARVCADGRVRDNLRYHGAGTGRWSGVGLQPQNLKRPDLSPDEAVRWLEHLATKDTVPGVAYSRGIVLLGDCVRGSIKAEPGHVLVASDYSQIELRALLWLAQDEKNLQEIRDGLDPYKTMAARIFEGFTYETVGKHERQAGKTAVLGCGYQAGARGMQKFATGYGFKWTTKEAQRIVDAYRTKHPAVVSFWYELQEAAHLAVRNPGATYRARRLFVRCKKNRRWLEIMLPSGRPLRYYQPRIEKVWTDFEGALDEPMQVDQLQFDGLDTYSRRWGTTSTYGGKLVENATQGLARDIMAAGMLRAEDAGLTPVLTVHDEVVCHEPAETEADAAAALETLNRCLLKLPAWAEGLPLAAEGWAGPRYRK